MHDTGVSLKINTQFIDSALYRSSRGRWPGLSKNGLVRVIAWLKGQGCLGDAMVLDIGKALALS